MEDYVTPPAAPYVAPSSFTYAPPTSHAAGGAKPNLWRSDERVDRPSYAAKMEEKEFHSDKGACTGTLLARTTGLEAPREEMTVSKGFLDSLTGAAVELPPRAPTQPVKKAAPAAFSFAEEDADASRVWEEERAARAAVEAANAAKRKAKRDKKKSKKKAKSTAVGRGEEEDTDNDLEAE